MVANRRHDGCRIEIVDHFVHGLVAWLLFGLKKESVVIDLWFGYGCTCYRVSWRGSGLFYLSLHNFGVCFNMKRNVQYWNNRLLKKGIVLFHW